MRLLKVLNIALYLCFLLSVIQTSEIYAQAASNNWMIVQDLTDRIVYIDTSNIKEFDNQLSVWSQVIYRTPKDVNPFNQRVKRIKTQFLINEATKTYSAIGTLYYDSRGKIIGETSIPSYSVGSDNFAIEIQPNSTIEVVFNKAKEQLENGKIQSEPSEFLTNNEQNNDSVEDKPAVKNSNTVETNDSLYYTTLDNRLKQNTQVETRAPGENIKSEEPNKNLTDDNERMNNKEPEITADVQGINNIYNPSSSDTSNISKNKNELVFDQDEPKVNKPEVSTNTKTSEKENQSYDNSSERNVKSTIFTDGNSYCFQVSSWRNKSKAQTEADKLKNRGFDAFVVEAYVPSKGGTWYRVRVGYFDTLRETEKVRKQTM